MTTATRRIRGLTDEREAWPCRPAQFDARRWLDFPTDGMRLVVGTREEWEVVAGLEPRERR